MDFCPRCGTRLILAKKRGSKVTLLFSCQRCRYKKRAAGLMPSIIQTVDHPRREAIAVVGKKELKLQTFPTIKINCCKCGNRLAYTWIVQTSDLEKSSTQFFRCTKCNYTFRENS